MPLRERQEIQKMLRRLSAWPVNPAGRNAWYGQTNRGRLAYLVNLSRNPVESTTSLRTRPNAGLLK